MEPFTVALQQFYEGPIGTWLVEIGNEMVTLAGQLIWIGVPFLLLTEILKRLPETDRHNFRLAHQERPFFNREFETDLAFPIIGALFMVPLFALRQFFVYEALLEPFFPFQVFDEQIQAWPMWLQVVIGLVVLDFSLYIRHRFVHNHLWAYHTVHHSAKELTWLTWARLHPIDAFVMGIIDATIVFILGFSGEAFAMSILLMGHFNRLNHSNIQLDYPAPLRYILVSPNMHRWHHAADDPKAFHKNFCIVFAWIDLLFGTFYVPKNRLPSEYGVLTEDGRDVAEPTFMAQLLYPFQENARWLRRKFRDAPPEEAQGE